MSAKRQATTDLNHENWNQEEEPEERGTFRTAPEEELSNRVIKKARRRIAGSSADVGDGNAPTTSKSVFSGFSGFGTKAASQPLSSTSTSGAFSFLSKIPAVSAAPSSFSSAASSSFASGAPALSGSTVPSSATSSSNTNTGSSPSSSFANTSSIATSKPTFSFGNPSITTSTTTAKKTDTEILSGNNNVKTTNIAVQKSGNYCAKIKVLNQTISDWIKTNVEKNPICLLTPIFNEYQQFLTEIEAEEKSTTTLPEKSSSTENITTETNPTPKFTFGVPARTSDTIKSGSSLFGNVASKEPVTELPKANGFTFNTPISKLPTQTSINADSFSFGFAKSSGSQEKKSTGFSFTSSSTPFSFGNIKPSTSVPTKSTENKDADEDDDEEPPKEEIKQVVEEDAVFSKKCKVFVKNDDNYGDRGVGTLYLKPIPESKKTQLVVRADTNLGNILLNFILNDTIPTKRTGKNNVMLVCLPTPECKKPAPILIRVKTGEEADELLKTIDEYKK